MVWTELRGPGDLELPSVGAAGADGVNGILSNVTLLKSGIYSVANADKGKAIDMTGDFWALTFPAAASVDGDFYALVHNADAARFKKLVIPGISGFGVTGDYWLPPKHNAVVRKTNGLWTLEKSLRWKVPRATTVSIFCNHATGSDSLNDGMVIGSPFQRLQRALEFILNECDPNGTESPTKFQIEMAAAVTSDPGIHFSPHSFHGGQGGQFARVNFGAGGGITAAGADSCVETYYGLVLQFLGGVFAAASGSIFAPDWGSKLYISGAKLGVAGTAHFFIKNGSQVELFGDLEVTGDPGLYHIVAQGGGQYRQQTWDTLINAACTVTDWVIAQKHALIDFSPAGSSFTLGTGSVTGRRGNALELGLIRSQTGTPDTFFPGSVAGTESTGGKWL